MIPARDSSAVYWYSGQRTVIRDMGFQIPENKGFKATYLCFYDFLELVLFFYYYYFIQSGNN